MEIAVLDEPIRWSHSDGRRPWYGRGFQLPVRLWGALAHAGGLPRPLGDGQREGDETAGDRTRNVVRDRLILGRQPSTAPLSTQAASVAGGERGGPPG